MRIIRISGAVLAAAAFALWSLAAEAANPRIALVIGEQTYADAALPTAANDAGLIAQVLQTAGFDVVGARDLDQKSVREALRDFLDRANAAGPDMQAFVYFSGRAVQYSGDNYLAPIDAHIVRASDTPIEAVKLSDFTHALAAAPGLARVVVIDAARGNPYAQQGEPLAGGLALVDPEPNSVIAFNAAPGAIAAPDGQEYSVYAKTLAGLMRQGGVDIRDVLAQTRVEVNQQTQGAQVPWSAGKLDARYFLFERAADAKPVAVKRTAKKPLKQLSREEAYTAVIDRDDLNDYQEYVRDFPDAPEARRVEAMLAARREALFWRRTLRENNPRAYWTYLRRYPRGPHAWDAGRRLDTLAARREPPHDFRALDYDDLPPPPPREIEYADRPVYFFGGDDFGPPPPRPPRGYYDEGDDDDWRALPPPQRPTAAGLLPALAVAIPLGLAARAYMGRPHGDGRAPASAPPPAPRPNAPPPLPRGVQAVTAPAPTGTPKPPTLLTPAGANPTPLPGGTPLPTPVGAKPSPLPSVTPPPTPTPTPTPLGAKPLPGATPLPTPVGGKPAPLPVGTPLPTPTPVGAKPSPLPSGTPLPTPVGAKPLPSAVKPSPMPSAPLAPAVATPSPTPQAIKAQPLATRSPAPELKPVETPKPAPKVMEAPKAVPPPPKIEAPKPPPPPAPKIEAPKPPPPPAPRIEAPKPPPPPPPKIEAPKPPPPPAPKVEAPKPPPPPAPKIEAPKPPPPPPPKVEAPKPPPPPAPKVEAPKPATPPPAAACGHPGQPHC